MKRKLFYGAIIVVCFISIILAIVVQFSKTSNQPNQILNSADVNIENNTEPGETENPIDYDAIKNEFNNLFANTFESNNYQESKIEKISEEQKLVFPYTIHEKKEGRYTLDINIPFVNIKQEEAEKLNTKSNDLFIKKANEIVSSTDAQNTTYTIDYTASITQDILSIAIKATLKEGSNPQRVMIQTYNYDLKNNQQVTLSQILQNWEMDEKDTQTAILNGITEINKTSEALIQSGYDVYQRNLEDEMYKIANSNYFYIDKTGRIYVIYPYGNNQETSEYDVIAF